MTGDQKYYVRLPKYLVEALDDREKQMMNIFIDGAYPVDNGLYGLARAGYDFIRQLEYHYWHVYW